jgi:hypothetical protein
MRFLTCVSFSGAGVGLFSLEGIEPEAYLYKMAPVARIQIAPPLKYLKLCLSLLDLVSGT